MVNPMASALVGALIPQGQRAKIISWFQAGMAVCVLVGSPIITYITGAWGWKVNFLLFAIPIVVASFAIVYIAVPSSAPQGGLNSVQESVIGGFKKVLVNRSALSCVACSILADAAWAVTPVYGITYMRQVTQLPLSLSWLILVGTSTSFMVGGIMGGYLVNRFGRLRLATVSASIVGLLIIAYMNIAISIVAAMLVFASCFFSSIRYTASESLTLEQIPVMRGTVMSLYSIAMSLGMALGTIIGGYLLIHFGFNGVGFLGLLSIAAALLYRSSVKDPMSKK